jgi:hypothetical protein
MPDVKQIRIGYGPISMSLEASGDRRRFCHYAGKRKIPFEIARPGETYKVVVLTQGADISVWRSYERNGTKIILDMPDAYLAIPRLDPKGLLRGLAKFAVRQNRRLLLNYTRGLEEMCERADAVVCASQEQATLVSPFCSNVHAVLDFQGACIRTRKEQYAAGEVFHLVWEGLPGNVQFLREIADVLRDLQGRHKIALHVITALRYGKYLHGRIAQRRTEDEARKIFEPIYVYAWNEQTISAISCACDLAVIPIPLSNELCAGKPENKLLFFWRLGIPAVVTATPAHLRTMRQCGLSMACHSPEDWKTLLERYICDEDARREAGQRGKAFAEQYHGEERMLTEWDAVFRSVLGEGNESNGIESELLASANSVQSVAPRHGNRAGKYEKK